MIYEVAEIDIKPGMNAEFESAVDRAQTLFLAASGCRSLRLERSIEYPDRYRLVVGWNSVEDHMETFRSSEEFQQWRRLAGPHFATPPRVEHVRCVLQGFG